MYLVDYLQVILSEILQNLEIKTKIFTAYSRIVRFLIMVKIFNRLLASNFIINFTKFENQNQNYTKVEINTHYLLD